ncbi:hypothetical protein K7X08_001574 [Anisodus acutangulus]|uniref:Uncharacterized protein n=1 Tax=Anisodus acutangulus TaxID=402998 RepID=A0A9Q1RN48_9SOLA|nr:hypothetical protein K7X08_001574 [Anisodus acutangulus]
MVALLVMVGSFYTGTLFGNNPSLYVPQQDQERLQQQQQLSIASKFKFLRIYHWSSRVQVVETDCIQ